MKLIENILLIFAIIFFLSFIIIFFLFGPKVFVITPNINGMIMLNNNPLINVSITLCSEDSDHKNICENTLTDIEGKLHFDGRRRYYLSYSIFEKIERFDEWTLEIKFNETQNYTIYSSRGEITMGLYTGHFICNFNDLNNSEILIIHYDRNYEKLQKSNNENICICLE